MLRYLYDYGIPAFLTIYHLNSVRFPMLQLLLPLD